MFRYEPVRVASLFAALLSAAILFGLNISSDQEEGLLRVANIIIPMIFIGAGEIGRSGAVAVPKAEAKIEQAYYRTPGEHEKPTLV